MNRGQEEVRREIEESLLDLLGPDLEPDYWEYRWWENDEWHDEEFDWDQEWVDMAFSHGDECWVREEDCEGYSLVPLAPTEPDEWEWQEVA